LQAPSQETIDVDVAIIGAGPAGLSAAIYVARANRTVVVLQGKIPSALERAHDIENYAGVPPEPGTDLLARMRQQVIDLGVRIIAEDAIAMILGMTPKGITTRAKLIYAKAVIIATGRGLKAGLIVNEDELLGRGVSYCALCDGPLYREKDVIVYGNDEETLEDALNLAQITCNVTLVNEKTMEEVNPALAAEIQSSPNPITVLENAKLTEILKADQGNVGGGRIILNDGTEQDIPAKAVFIISRVKSSTLLTQAGIMMSENGCIPTDQQQRTNLDGVFAAGDVTCGERQVSIAVGQGAVAGIEASRYVRM